MTNSAARITFDLGGIVFMMSELYHTLDSEIKYNADTYSAEQLAALNELHRTCWEAGCDLRTGTNKLNEASTT